jgi:hypothetical protein
MSLDLQVGPQDLRKRSWMNKPIAISIQTQEGIASTILYRSIMAPQGPCLISIPATSSRPQGREVSKVSEGYPEQVRR